MHFVRDPLYRAATRKFLLSEENVAPGPKNDHLFFGEKPSRPKKFAHSDSPAPGVSQVALGQIANQLNQLLRAVAGAI
jgi:hypothetical protein